MKLRKDFELLNIVESVIDIWTGQLVRTFLIRGVWTEERNRQETEDRVGGGSSEYSNKSPEFVTPSPYISQPNGEGTTLL